MNIICLVKPVPDVENFSYDYEHHVLLRDRGYQIINPDDETAVSAAFDLKQQFPGSTVETLTMAPPGARPYLEDLIRRGVDRAVHISDPLFAGSDTYATSGVLAKFLMDQTYDIILSGTQTLDGGTAHIPAQVAELLGIQHISDVSRIDRIALEEQTATVNVESEDSLYTFEIDLPAVLGMAYSARNRLPYIPYDAINEEVGGKMKTVTNTDLGLERSRVGLTGSMTQVLRVEVHTYARKEILRVGTDDESIDQVYQFLEKRGFLQP